MKHILNIGKLLGGVALLWLVGRLAAPHILSLIEHSESRHTLEFLLPWAGFALASFTSTYLSHQRPLPSFVAALFIGQALKPYFHETLGNAQQLEGIVTLLAAMILFQGGLETPLANFRRLFPKIFLLAFPGVVITAVGLAYGAHLIGGVGLSITTVVLLGAILSSTDPAAVIPLFKPLTFRNDDVKDVAISESAMNDVVGALLFFTFLSGLAAVGGAFTSINQAFTGLVTSTSLVFLLKQLAIGAIFGAAGWALLQLYYYSFKRKELSTGVRGVAMLTVPIVSFFVSAAFGGSGYLAAFVAGLLFHVSHDREKDVEHYGEHFIDSIAKPIIFTLLGAMVDLKSLATYAGVGIAVALLFIFILRPLMVAFMLGPFTRFGRTPMGWNQLLFLGWIRETGAIPAVLLVTVVGKSIAGTEALLPIGMWVILMTLVIQPPLTPWIARRLNIAYPRTQADSPEMV